MSAAPVRTVAAPDRAAPVQTRGRGWSAAGIAAGLTGAASLVASSSADAVYTEELAGDARGLTERLGEQLPQILVWHVTTMVTTLLVVVFAAGLHRRMATQLPAGSLLAPVAASGLLLVSVTGLLGTALTTEFVFGLTDPDLLVPETAVFFGHWIGTVPWLWGTVGLTALAVGAASLRHGAVAPRWFGRVSAVVGGLLCLLAVSPLQYMAGMLAPLWLLALAVLLHRRAR